MTEVARDAAASAVGPAKQLDQEQQTSPMPSPVPPEVVSRMARRIKKFGVIVSPLDPADARANVHTSEFRGIYNLAIICGALYTFSSAVSNWQSRGDVTDTTLGRAVFATWHFAEVLVTFACQGLYTYTALIPVSMAGSRFALLRHHVLINTVHHTLQSVLFFFTVVFIIYRDWGTIHAVSAFVECLVLLMKMHSYIRTQLEISRTSGKPPTPNLKDYTVYLSHPTLVYEPAFPRTDRIRWGYVAEKFIAITLAMALFYLIVSDHVMPQLEDAGLENPVIVIINLLLPFLGCYLMIWFIIFECICNGLAEVTYLADRDFYGDWWNSTTFDEFARKWNKPVHEFLLRHVYFETLETYKLTRRTATILTFMVSAALHECVFAIIFRTVKLYFFVLQMMQVVVIIYGRGLKNTRAGNYIFWLGMILGIPLQAVIYCREYHGGEPIFMNVMVPMWLGGFGTIVVSSLAFVRAPAKKKD